MRELIFQEIRRLKIKANEVWAPASFSKFVGEHYQVGSYKDFQKEMNDLCNCNFFIKEPYLQTKDFYKYTLTEKGYGIIYKK